MGFRVPPPPLQSNCLPAFCILMSISGWKVVNPKSPVIGRNVALGLPKSKSSNASGVRHTNPH